MNKLNYGIKISKKGFSVIDLKQKRVSKTAKESFSHLTYALAMPYLQGARIQVQRYQVAASTLEKKPTYAVIECIHEVSSLFEDLCTIASYAEKNGNTHKLHELWCEVRHHIRHDIREQLDDEDHKRKNKRASVLKINPKLQTSIGFSIDCIKVGETEIGISQISSYLGWAEKVIIKIFKEAKEKGQLKKYEKYKYKNKKA